MKIIGWAFAGVLLAGTAHAACAPFSNGTPLSATALNNCTQNIPASNITGLAPSATTDTTNAANISTGSLPSARLPASIPVVNLNGGTGASASTFWRGDGTWTGVMPTIAAGHIVGNGTSGSAAAADSTASSILDQAFGTAQGSLLMRGASLWAPLVPSSTAGQVLTSNGTGASLTFTTVTGTGTVTSVGASGGSTGLTLSGGPITAAGTLTLGGTLGVANGGTGLGTLTLNGVVIGNGTTAPTFAASSIANQVLTANTSGAPTFQTPAVLSGTGSLVALDSGGNAVTASLGNGLSLSAGAGTAALSAVTGTNSVLGAVKCDGTTTSCVSGAVTVIGGGGGGSGAEVITPISTSTTISNTLLYNLLHGTGSSSNTWTLSFNTTNSWVDVENDGTGPIVLTPASGTISNLPSQTVFTSQSGRISFDGTNYIWSPGTFQGQTTDQLPLATAVTNNDVIPTVQAGSGSNTTQQSFGNILTWIFNNLSNYTPTVNTFATDTVLDFATKNGTYMVLNTGVTKLQLPAGSPNIGIGFNAVVFNDSGVAVTLDNNGATWGSWKSTTGTLSIPNNAMAYIQSVQPGAQVEVWADIIGCQAFTSTIAGCTPASGGGTTNFLRADGTWAAPPGGGGSANSGWAPISGRYYSPIVQSVNNSSGIVASRLTALPVRLSAGTYKGAAFLVQNGPTGSSTTCRMGVYADTNGLPANLLAENTINVAIGGTGTETALFTGGNLTLANDTNVWLAMICNGPNAMALSAAFPTAAAAPEYQVAQLGLNAPLGTGSLQLGLFSSVVTNPAVTLASQNSGNFGAVTYMTTAVPIVNIQAN